MRPSSPWKIHPQSETFIHPVNVRYLRAHWLGKSEENSASVQRQQFGSACASFASRFSRHFPINPWGCWTEGIRGEPRIRVPFEHDGLLDGVPTSVWQAVGCGPPSGQLDIFSLKRLPNVASNYLFISIYNININISEADTC